MQTFLERSDKIVLAMYDIQYENLSSLSRAVVLLVLRTMMIIERAGLHKSFTLTVRVQGRQVSAKIEAIPTGTLTLDEKHAA